jgi:hypothetical protein
MSQDIYISGNLVPEILQKYFDRNSDIDKSEFMIKAAVFYITSSSTSKILEAEVKKRMDSCRKLREEHQRMELEMKK